MKIRKFQSKKPSRVIFIDDKIRKTYSKLKKGDDSERKLHQYILNALTEIKKDPYCGNKIKQRIWKKPYSSLAPPNIWKYDLPNAWRIIYTIHEKEIEVLCIIVEWFNHKEYEKKFNYTVRESYPTLLRA